MHNELKIIDMQTLESNKNISIENPSEENLVKLPDFTTESYKDAYSRINAIVIEGEQEAHDNYISIATLIPNELEELMEEFMIAYQDSLLEIGLDNREIARMALAAVI